MSSCMLAIRICSCDFSTAILSSQNLVLWIRCLQRSSNGTTRNFCDNNFNLTGKHASNCDGCPAFTACLTNSNGDQGLPQVWTSCSRWSSFSSAVLPNIIGGGKDWSSPPSSVEVFAGWIDRSFDPFGNIGLLGASNLISSLHFWYSWKSGKTSVTAWSLTRALNVGTKGGIRLALGCRPVAAIICCSDLRDVDFNWCNVSSGALIPRVIKAIAMQFASIFARPIGYAVSSLVANFFLFLSNPQAACLCLEFWPLHLADTAWNVSWLKASIVFFLPKPPYWHEWNTLYCICFATVSQNVVAQNRLNCGFSTLMTFFFGWVGIVGVIILHLVGLI